MRLTGRFIILLLVTLVLPLIFLAVFLNIEFRRSVQKENSALLSTLVNSVGVDAEKYYTETRHSVELMSLEPEFAQLLELVASAQTDMQTIRLNASTQMEKQAAKITELKNLLLIDHNGRVVLSLKGERVGESYTSNTQLQQMADKEAYSSKILYSESHGAYFFHSAAIGTKNGQLLGFLVAELDIAYFATAARNITVGEEGYIYFVDAGGIVFAHRYPERQTTVLAFSHDGGFYEQYEQIIQPGAPAKGEIIYNYTNSSRLYGAYSRLDFIDGYLFAVRSEEEMNRAFGKMTLLLNLGLLGLGVLGVAGMAFSITSIKRPVYQLLRSIGSILKENGYIRCEYEAGNELGWMAGEVNRLNFDVSTHIADLKENEQRYRTALEAVSDIVWEYDVETQKYTFMAKDKGMLGARRIENVEIVNCPWAYAADPETEARRDSEFKRFIRGDVRTYRHEYETRDIRGNPTWAESIATALKNKDDKIVRVIGSISDITQKKLYDMRVLHSAEFDKLTSVYNRATIERRVKESLPLSPRSALIMIDLDNFKVINDTFGHQFGDQILQFVSASILKTVSPQDLVGRIGGDEFIVYIREYLNEETLENISAGIVAALQSGYEKEGVTYRLSGSVGVAEAFAFGAESYKSLLSNADFAMYSAKRKGKNKFMLFNEELYREKVKIDVVACHIKNMAGSDILTLRLMPIYCTCNDRVVRFYADVDIKIPEYPEVKRDEVYRIAMESNQQAALLEHTFRWVCRAIRELDPHNAYHTAVTYRIPAISIVNETMLSVLTRVVEEEGVDTKNLALSLEPKTVSAFDRSAHNFINSLRQICSDIELSSYGGMYTSYNIVSDFNFDSVLFSEEMVVKALHSRKHMAILDSIMDIARQTSTACTLLLTAAHREFFRDKLSSGCYQYCTGTRVTTENALAMLQSRTPLVNKFECQNYKTRLLENTILGL